MCDLFGGGFEKILVRKRDVVGMVGWVFRDLKFRTMKDCNISEMQLYFVVKIELSLK